MTNTDRKIIKVMFAIIVELLFGVVVGPYYAPYFNSILEMRQNYNKVKKLIEDWGEKAESCPRGCRREE